MMFVIDFIPKSGYIFNMKHKFLLLAALLMPFQALAKPLVVAVIDTGFGYHNKGHQAKLCKYGHKDFTSQGMYSLNYGTVDPIPQDLHGHGTNIVGGIAKYAGKADYCIVVLKFYRPEASGSQNLAATIRALKYARDIKVDIINYSGGGAEYSSAEEKSVVQFLDSGGTLVSAAGNEYKNLDLSGNSYYPAMYDKRIIVVGNGVNAQDRAPTSNYGAVVKHWEPGTVDMYGIKLSGTSQSTAIVTGKIINERFRQSEKARSRNATR